jgi:transcriptional regulator GlxA family with amidase domain
MKIVIPIFDRVTALDAIGPYEVLSRLPGAEVVFAAQEPGVYRSDNGMLGLQADAALADVPDPEVVMMPGGFGTRPLMKDERMLDWLRGAHGSSDWTTSVCTGALVLAAAGLLDGLEATTHWAAVDILAAHGARPCDRRVVEQGKIVTAAGVSAGIDMALHLAGRIAGPIVAQAIQLAIEYDPQPPFDSGSTAKAAPEVVELVRRSEAVQS